MGVGSISELQSPDGEFQSFDVDGMFRPVEDDDATNEFMKHWTKRRTKKNVGNEIVDSNKESKKKGSLERQNPH